MILCTFILSCHCHHHPSPGPFHLPELKLCPLKTSAPFPLPSPWHPPFYLGSMNVATLGTLCHFSFLFNLDAVKDYPNSFAHPTVPVSHVQRLWYGTAIWEAGTYLIYSLASINKLSPTQVTATRDGKWCLNRQRKRNVVLREYEWLDLSPQWESNALSPLRGWWAKGRYCRARVSTGNHISKLLLWFLVAYCCFTFLFYYFFDRSDSSSLPYLCTNPLAGPGPWYSWVVRGYSECPCI